MFAPSIRILAITGLAAASTLASVPQQAEWYGQVVAQSTLEPVPGARLSVEHVGTSASGDVLAPSSARPAAPPQVERAGAVVTADRTGRFAIAAAASARLRISAPGFLDGFVQLHEQRDRGLGRLVLREEMSITGRLLIAGEPAAGVTVLAPAEHDHGMPSTPSPSTRSDAEGMFHLGNLRPEQLEELVFVRGGVAEALDLGHALFPFDPRHYELGDIELSPLETLRGRAVDPDGRPISGAEVLLSNSSSLRLPARSNSNDVEERIPRPQTISGADGGFSLSLPAGQHTLLVLDPSGGYGSHEVVLSGDDSPADRELAVIQSPAGVTRRGRILDPDGNPLAGVAVSLTSSAGSALLDSELAARPDAPYTYTDANGCYTLTGLAAGRTVLPEARLAGFATQRIRVDVEAGAQPSNPGFCADIEPVVLQPAARLTGTVVNDLGNPVAGATIHVHHHQERRSIFFPGGAPPTTDEEGRFVIEALPFGDYSLDVRAADHANTSMENLAVGPLPLPEGPDSGGSGLAVTPLSLADDSGTYSVRIVMPRIRGTGTLEVVVFDPRGAPEPEAQVQVNLSTDGMPLTVPPAPAFTGADGRIRLSGLPLGPYSIAAQADGRRHSSGWQSPYRVAAGASPAIVEMRPLPPRGSLTGRLVDATGRGIGRAVIEARGSVRTWREARALTEADGSFRFTSLPAGTYVLKAVADGHAEVVHHESLDVDPAGIDNVVIQIPAAAAIVGTVSGLRPEEATAYSVIAYRDVTYGDIGQHTSVPGTTAVDGSFRIEPVAPGTWTVRARTRTNRTTSTEIVVVEAGSITAADVTLPSGFRLSGRLIRGSADSIRGAADNTRGMIYLNGESTSDTRFIEVDANGRFDAPDLPADRYELLITGAGLHAPIFEHVDVTDDTHVEIVMRGAAVAGMVVDADTGLPIPGVSVRTDPIPQRTSDMHAQFRETDRYGRFTAGPFPVGPWSFEFTAPGYAKRAPVIEIGDEDVGDFRLALERTPGLHLRFETPDGTRPRSISLAWFDLEHGEGFQGSAFPQSRDSMELDWANIGLTRGVLYAASGRDRLAARLVVTNDGTPLVVRLGGAGTLYVDVPELPTDVHGAVMRLFDVDDLPVTNSIGGLDWTSRRDGVFRAPTLPPGVYHVVVSAEDGRTWTGEAEIHPFQDTNVVLR